jgi:hypothetical protein
MSLWSLRFDRALIDGCEFSLPSFKSIYSPDSRRNNYKRELKRQNKGHPMQSKREQFPHENLRMNDGQSCSDTFPENQELALKVDWIRMDGLTLYSRRGGFQDPALSTLLLCWRFKTVLKFTASLRVTWCLFHQGGFSLDLSIQGSEANHHGSLSNLPV